MQQRTSYGIASQKCEGDCEREHPNTKSVMIFEIYVREL